MFSETKNDIHNYLHKSELHDLLHQPGLMNSFGPETLRPDITIDVVENIPQHL